MLFPLLLSYSCPSISSPFILPYVIPCTSTILPIISYLILPFFTFLTPTGGWYLMIVCGQAAHIWVCRTTTVSIFQHGVFTNKITNIGVVVALLLGCFVTYCPGKAAAPMLYFGLYYFLRKSFPQSSLFVFINFSSFSSSSSSRSPNDRPIREPWLSAHPLRFSFRLFRTLVSEHRVLSLCFLPSYSFSFSYLSTLSYLLLFSFSYLFLFYFYSGHKPRDVSTSLADTLALPSLTGYSPGKQHFWLSWSAVWRSLWCYDVQ